MGSVADALLAELAGADVGWAPLRPAETAKAKTQPARRPTEEHARRWAVTNRFMVSKGKRGRGAPRGKGNVFSNAER
jgi:hypothetical protein